MVALRERFRAGLVRVGPEAVHIPPSAERIVIGAADPFRPCGSPNAYCGRGRKRIDGAGPVFLFMLLGAGFVPSLLGQFDMDRLLRALQAAITALARPSPAFVAADQSPTGPSRLQACCPAGFQVADTAATMFDGSFAPRSVSRGAHGRRRKPFRRRRPRGGLSPRAPPPVPYSPYPERN